MHLYLIRHAEAEDLVRAGKHGISTGQDRSGAADSQALADAFLQRNIVVDAIAVSPLVRGAPDGRGVRVGACPASARRDLR